jgi:CheY-like chemotaxis protein
LKALKGDQRFDLLLSDVVMPNGISGVELAYEARRLKRDIKVLLTSGCFGGELERHGDEFPSIDKPYRLADLARRLRSILNGVET